MKDRYLRARLPEIEYLDVKIAADRAGLTLSEHVRCVLVRDRQADGQENFLAKISAKLVGFTQPQESNSANTAFEPLLVETLLLVRELVAERNAQILGRIAHQLNARYPNRNVI